MNSTETIINVSSNDVTAIATSITAITAVIILIYVILDRRTKVRMERFPEPNTSPQIWKIRVHYSNKSIESCSILLDETKLIWDGTNLEEFDIVEGVSRNVTIPNDIFKMDAKITVKGNGHSIKKTVFHKIRLGSASF